jgi:hypothetical protein
MRSEAHNYQVGHISDDVIHVSRIGVCNSKPRTFSKSNETPCDCRHKVALRIQSCPHETALANGDFLSHFHNTEGDNIAVQECASSGEPEDDVSLPDSGSINMPLPSTFPDESIPTTQDSFFDAGGVSQDDNNSGVGDNDESILCHSHQLLTDDVVMAPSGSTITYAMLKRVACELVEVAMKQNDASKKVSVCGMMLRVTNLLRGNDSLARAGFDANLFPGRSVPNAKVPASVPCNGRPTTNRLMSRTEAFRHPKNGASKRRSCGFCLEDGHTVNQCTLMAQQGKHVPQSDKDPFCYDILETFAVK